MSFLTQYFARLHRSHQASGHRRRVLRWAMFLVTASVCLGASAQLVPDAPVSNFRLPMFGDDGHPIWELRGKEGRYINTDQVDLSGMRLLIYADEPRDRVETTILSPRATLLIPKNQIVGEGTITVEGDNYVITGERWLWDGNEDSVVIDENVKVTFSEKLTGILQ